MRNLTAWASFLDVYSNQGPDLEQSVNGLYAELKHQEGAWEAYRHTTRLLERSYESCLLTDEPVQEAIEPALTNRQALKRLQQVSGTRIRQYRKANELNLRQLANHCFYDLNVSSLGHAALAKLIPELTYEELIAAMQNYFDDALSALFLTNNDYAI